MLNACGTLAVCEAYFFFPYKAFAVSLSNGEEG